MGVSGKISPIGSSARHFRTRPTGFADQSWCHPAWTYCSTCMCPHGGGYACGMADAMRLYADPGVPAWIRQKLADTLLRRNPGLADENVLVALAKSEELDEHVRASFVVDMIRSGMAAAEPILKGLLREAESILGWPDLARRLSGSGRTAQRALESIARSEDLDWGVRCEAVMVLGATLTVGQIEVLVDELMPGMPEIWHGRLVLGLARNGLAFDVELLLAKTRSLPGGYRILYEFLQRAPLLEPVMQKVISAATGILADSDSSDKSGHERGSLFTLDAGAVK